MSYGYSLDSDGKGTHFQWCVSSEKLIITVSSVVVVLNKDDVKMLLKFLDQCEIEEKVME